jgi:hypothetical protein
MWMGWPSAKLTELLELPFGFCHERSLPFIWVGEAGRIFPHGNPATTELGFLNRRTCWK